MLKRSRKKLNNSNNRKKILLVDDEEAMLDIFKSVLQEDNYFVAVARNGAEALTLFKENSFDLVITDLKMPGMDGIKLLVEMLKIDSTADVIVLTAYSSAESYRDAMRCGATEYMYKPLRLEEFKAAVQKHLNYSRNGYIARLKAKLNQLISKIH
jgi:DNA-binding NtrC family response regulator